MWPNKSSGYIKQYKDGWHRTDKNTGIREAERKAGIEAKGRAKGGKERREGENEREPEKFPSTSKQRHTHTGGAREWHTTY